MPESDKTILAVYKSLDDENSGRRGSGVSGSRQQATESTGTREYSLRQQQEAGEWQRNQDAGWRHMGWREVVCTQQQRSSRAAAGLALEAVVAGSSRAAAGVALGAVVAGGLIWRVAIFAEGRIRRADG